jgi:hypothetical protein
MLKKSRNTGRLHPVYITLLSLGVIILCFSALFKPCFNRYNEHVCAREVQCEGSIVYANLTPPPLPQPSSGVDLIGLLIGISNIAAAFLVILAVAKAIAGLAKWLYWTAKYGKNRTPIMMPVPTNLHKKRGGDLSAFRVG